MQDFRKLEVYKKAMEYCGRIYAFSARLPAQEKYGLVTQIRRAASSIPLNISEGAGCSSGKELSLFVNYAYRSVNEVLTCLQLIKELALSNDKNRIEELEAEGIRLSCMLYAFFKKLSIKT